MNIVNMGAKGVDGQLSGVVIISALTIAFLSLKYSADIAQWPVIILAAITTGAYLGFLPWHIYPQKIMPGYGGSTIAGYLLAVLSILSTTKVGALVVVLGVPLIDTGYTIVRRLLSGKSPVWGDRGHLHHRLLDAGMSKSQVAIFYWIITALLGVLALNLNTATKIYTIVGVGTLVGGLIIWLTYRPKTKDQKIV
jgi:UDP-GlcNAc:undecaprenyl-phosphate GlcNAc-1-phosphate transferase